MKGDHRAAEWLDARFAKYEPINVEPDLTRALLDDDFEILRNAAERGIMLVPEPPHSIQAATLPGWLFPTSDEPEDER